MAAVGITELKKQLSRYLKRVRAGERLVVTQRGDPVAILSPPPSSPENRRFEVLLRRGTARWGGGKPRGISHPPRVKGPPVAQAVIEDRR